MGDKLFYTGLIITGFATITLIFFRIRQSHKREEVKNMPLRLEEWETQFRKKRLYFFIAQMLGIAVAILGLNL